MTRFLAVLAFLGLTGTLSTVHAQNLLFNGDLNASPPSTYFDGSDPSVADNVPGWHLYLGSALEGSYVLVSTEVDPAAGGIDADMAIGPSGGGMQTAATLRPVVVPGLSYIASFTHDNYFAPTSTSYFIDWFDLGGSLLSSSGGPAGDPNGPLGYAPYTQTFSVIAAAPSGAVTAGVRLLSGDGSYSGLAADNFSLSLVPEPTSAALIGLAGMLLINTVRRRR